MFGPAMSGSGRSLLVRAGTCVSRRCLKPVCLNAAETREQVKAHKLVEPFVALKEAAALGKAEALSARLCHADDEFIYEIALLHRDGRLSHVEMEAASGKLVSRAPHEASGPPK